MSKLLCLCVVLLTSSSLHAQERNWSDSTGSYKVVAELVGVKNDSAILRKTDGEQVVVPLKRLSKDDQQFVTKWQKDQSTKQPAGEKDSKDVDWTADVKTKATAKREPGFDYDFNSKDPMPEVVVSVDLMGNAAASAIQFGKLKIDSCQDGKGNDLKIEVEKFGVDISKEMDKIQKRGEDFFPSHPENGIRFKIKSLDKSGSVKKISLVAGQIDVLTGGIEKTETIKDVSKHEKGPIDSDLLKELGIKCEFDRTGQEVKLKMVGEATLAAIKFVDSKGKTVEPDGWSAGGWKESWEYTYNFEKIPAADLVMEFRIDPVTVTLPFEAKNVKIKSR